ncbi:MAG TPA: potassium-transporting ATPase subunit KdpA [Opitutaceae bacterium]|jgi:K+-transporting ATPase ATPase A chain|nr:potassium-transporting ATPase subunit KdpA [Opitutaceae bacterium]
MNHPNAWVQLALYIGALLLITKPLGLYLLQVLDAKGRTWLDPVLRPVERLIYRGCGIDAAGEQTWLGYTISMLVFSAVGMLFTYAILRLQGRLPLNPQHLPSLTPHLAFNTAASFTTNTNWQFYTGESTMSYLSQMVALTFHNWASAATGIAIAAALVRGLARHSAKTLGCFWVDLVRISLYLLLPICFVFSLFLVSQGMPENFRPYTVAKTLEAHADQTIVQGPIASQISIKMLGTNGGGYTNANAAHPFENPTPLSNFIQMLSIFAIPSALTFYLGRMVRQPRHGWAVWTAMFVMFLAGVLACWRAESLGNPIHQHLGVAAADGNMEGKEVRFGILNSALFATITTDASCGAVNSMHDSFTPLGGLVPLFNLQTGEVIFGGVGAGLYGMLIYVVVAVFIAGLMVGRTPEYVGKKIESYDVKMAMLTLMILAATILGFTALSCVTKWGTDALGNAGPHGFSEILYAYSSCVGNNGSAFAGLSGNEVHWDTYTGVATLIGRFLMIVPILALAGNLAAKKFIPASAGTFRTEGTTFVVLLVGTVVLVGALTFLPGLAMGPIVEHYLMRAGALF